MPKMGESIVEATITGWLKQPGDTVEQDETILEIATDKVDSEVPSPVDGKLVEVLFAEGDTVEVDAVIAYIETEAAAGDDAPSAAPTSSESAPKADADPTPDKQPEPSPEKQPEPAMAAAVGADPKLTGALLDSPESGRFYSPLVLNIARTENIPMDELDRLPGTGKDGRVTKKDILSYVKLREEGGAPQPATSGASNGASNGQSKPQAKNGQAKTAKSAPQKAAPLAVSDPTIEETKTGVKFSPVASGGVQGIPQKTYTYNGGYEIQEMDRMRKMIADNMAISKQVSPHVSSFVECDVTTLFNWRKRNKHAFMEKYGEKLTFTPIFVMALAKAIREYPAINISVVGDKIIRKKDVNIGMAVAQPSGNLIVATIRNADELNLAGLTKRVNDLAKRARENKLSPMMSQTPRIRCRTWARLAISPARRF